MGTGRPVARGLDDCQRCDGDPTLSGHRGFREPLRTVSGQPYGRRVYTGYWLSGKYIYGPKDGGQFYLSGRYVYGPRNGGMYYVSGKYFYGPDSSGQFYLSGKHIYGPSADLPWLKS